MPCSNDISRVLPKEEQKEQDLVRKYTCFFFKLLSDKATGQCFSKFRAYKGRRNVSLRFRFQASIPPNSRILKHSVFLTKSWVILK